MAVDEVCRGPIARKEVPMMGMMGWMMGLFAMWMMIFGRAGFAPFGMGPQ